MTKKAWVPAFAGKSGRVSNFSLKLAVL